MPFADDLCSRPSHFADTSCLTSCKSSNHAADERPMCSAGLEVLTAMERVPTDDDDRPDAEIKITGVTVFVNPFKEMEEAEKKQAEEEKQKVGFLTGLTSQARLLPGPGSRGGLDTGLSAALCGGRRKRQLGRRPRRVGRGSAIPAWAKAVQLSVPESASISLLLLAGQQPGQRLRRSRSSPRRSSKPLVASETSTAGRASSPGVEAKALAARLCEDGCM